MILRRKVRRICPMQGFSLSIDVNTMILLSVLFYDFLRGLVLPLKGSSTLSAPINYLVIFMGLRWLALRRGLTDSAIIRIFAKI